MDVSSTTVNGSRAWARSVGFSAGLWFWAREVQQTFVEVRSEPRIGRLPKRLAHLGPLSCATQVELPRVLQHQAFYQQGVAASALFIPLPFPGRALAR